MALWHYWASLSASNRIALGSTVANAALVLVSLVAVGLTRSMMRRDREALVIGRIVAHDEVFNIMFFEIANIGRGLARDISIEYDPDPMLVTKKALSELAGHMVLLQPGEKVRVVLFNAADEKQVNTMFPDRTLKVRASWRDGSSLRRRCADATYRVDELFGLPVIGSRGELYGLLEELREVLLLVARGRVP